MENIGIIGAGHIGLTLAKLLKRKHAIDNAHLQISFKGRPSTRLQLEQAQLGSCVASNSSILHGSDIVFLTVKPRDFPEFQSSFSTEGLHTPVVVSTVAGYPLSHVKEALHYTHIINVMPSGPETLLEGKGICAMYPDDRQVRQLMEHLDIQVFPVDSEDAFTVFTTALCLPAAFLQMGRLPSESEMQQFAQQFRPLIPKVSQLLSWAKNVTPFHLDKAAQQEVIHHMSTPGGITENLVGHIGSGMPFLDAFAAAVDYCKSLSQSTSN